MTSTPTCTVGPSAVTGERCGKPAVRSIKGRSGETFHECAEHDSGPVATPTPARRSGWFTMPSGHKVRSESGRRFIVAAEHVSGHPVVVRRTDNRTTANETARRFSTAVVFDSVTGEIAR